MNILGIIPARGGSKGVPEKNIIQLCGKPLITYTIESAFKSKFLDKSVISTDSKKIADVVSEYYDIQIINRPAEFAKDNSPIEEALLHAVEYMNIKSGYNADIVVCMQPNIPIREKNTIDKAISIFIESDADSCITCYEINQIPELMKIIDSDGSLKPCEKEVKGIRRQEFSKRYLADGAVVVMKVENLFKYKGIRKAHAYMGEKIMPLIQKSRIYSIDIDEYDDLYFAECCMLHYKNQLQSGRMRYKKSYKDWCS